MVGWVDWWMGGFIICWIDRSLGQNIAISILTRLIDGVADNILDENKAFLIDGLL